MEDGLQKQVVEQYVVDALSFAEAEQRITEQMSQYISGEFEVTDVKKAAYKEIFFMSDAAKKFHNEVEDLTRALHKGDVEKLDEMSRANGGIITEQILCDCIKKVDKEG